MTTTATISDLTTAIAETLGLDDLAAVETAIREHRTAPYEAHAEGTPAREALERAVWADVTDGAEWPFGGEATANYGMLCDTRSGETLRPATREELIASLESEQRDDTGTILVEGRSVYVDRTHDDLDALGLGHLA